MNISYNWGKIEWYEIVMVLCYVHISFMILEGGVLHVSLNKSKSSYKTFFNLSISSLNDNL